MDNYVCTVCGYIYDPAVGDDDGGIKPGTKFSDIPEIGFVLYVGLVNQNLKSRIVI